MPVVMSPSGEDKLILLLTEIQSDIRQMKSDLQSLLRLLKQQQQRPTPPPSSSSDDIANGIESAQSGSPENLFVICGKREGMMIRDKQARA